MSERCKGTTPVNARFILHLPEYSGNQNAQSSYKAKEGVFYSYIYLQKEEEIIRIDCRTSDAIALAVRSDCPIYIYESILDRECIRLDDDDERPAENPDKENETSDSTNINSLENALEQAIKDENYELAARLRDEINRKK